MFSDVTGLVKGDDVRIAGVRVGSVEEHRDRATATRAPVTFTRRPDARLTRRPSDDPLPQPGRPALHRADPGRRRHPRCRGRTIPLSRTQPALDLTVLFNGFKPLFAALSPGDVNKLVRTRSSRSSRARAAPWRACSHTASVTTTLADRDKVIGELINNLNARAGHGRRPRRAAVRPDRPAAAVRVAGWPGRPEAILGSLDYISDLADADRRPGHGIRPSSPRTSTSCARWPPNARHGNQAELDRALQILPIKLEKIGRTAPYGSWFNFYLCNFNGRVMLPGVAPADVDYPVVSKTGGEVRSRMTALPRAQPRQRSGRSASPCSPLLILAAFRPTTCR